MSERCGSIWDDSLSAYTCDRRAGHSGKHRGGSGQYSHPQKWTEAQSALSAEKRARRLEQHIDWARRGYVGWNCGKCGAMVEGQERDRHDAWHATLTGTEGSRP